MTIEFEFNTITIQPQGVGNFHKLISKYLQTQKAPKKRRARKKKIPVSYLIDDIIESLEVE